MSPFHRLIDSINLGAKGMELSSVNQASEEHLKCKWGGIVVSANFTIGRVRLLRSPRDNPVTIPLLIPSLENIVRRSIIPDTTGKSYLEIYPQIIGKIGNRFVIQIVAQRIST